MRIDQDLIDFNFFPHEWNYYITEFQFKEFSKTLELIHTVSVQRLDVVR